MSEQSTSNSSTMTIRVTVGKKEDNLKNILNKIDSEKRALFCKEALVQHVLNIKNGSAVSAYVDKFELMSDEEKQLASAVTMQDLKDLFSSVFSNANFTVDNNNSDSSSNFDNDDDEGIVDNMPSAKMDNNSLEINKTTYNFDEDDEEYFVDDEDDIPL